ncbi:MAG: hypothetical protein V3W44_00665 [Dehalococcoidales bacterium]
MTDRNAIIKYLKVKALAEEGAPGERDNAQRIKAKMEADHPGIEQKAEAYRLAQEGVPMPHTAGHPFSRGNWENIFQFAAQAAGYAYNFAQSAVDAQFGAELAEEVRVYNRNTRSGRFVITLSLARETYQQAKHLNPAQREMFRNELHEFLDGQLDDLLEEPAEIYW